MMDPSRGRSSSRFRNRTPTPLVNPVEFSPLGSGGISLHFKLGSGGISLHFESDSWKLSGIQLPSAVLEALSRHLPAPG